MKQAGIVNGRRGSAKRRSRSTATVALVGASLLALTGLQVAVASLPASADRTTTWSATSEVTPTRGGQFNGVSCTSPGDCTAVGHDGNRDPVHATESAGLCGRSA